MEGTKNLKTLPKEKVGKSLVQINQDIMEISIDPCLVGPNFHIFICLDHLVLMDSDSTRQLLCFRKLPGFRYCPMKVSAHLNSGRLMIRFPGCSKDEFKKPEFFKILVDIS